MQDALETFRELCYPECERSIPMLVDALPHAFHAGKPRWERLWCGDGSFTRRLSGGAEVELPRGFLDPEISDDRPFYVDFKEENPH